MNNKIAIIFITIIIGISILNNNYTSASLNDYQNKNKIISSFSKLDMNTNLKENISRSPSLDISKLTNKTDIPTWYIGDTWMYNADIYSDSENGIFDLSSTDLSVSIINITTLMENGIHYDIYVLEISGIVSGYFSSSIITGDVTGVIYGTTSVRKADLSIIKSNISSIGVIEVLILEFDYEMSNIGKYYPPFEYFDFPLNSGEIWNISTTTSTQSSIYVEDLYDNYFEGNETITGTIGCIGVENVTVPAGTFESFHIYTENNNTIEMWYSPLVRNSIKTNINITNENETHIIKMNLTGYTLSSQILEITVGINPSISSFWDNATIIGGAYNISSGYPLINSNVTISIPYSNYQGFTTTNLSGNFSHIINVPIIIDNTDTTYDIGSDGIIVTINGNSVVGYKLKTLTVIDNTIKITKLLSSWNFISLPFNYTTNIENIIIKYNDTYLNWTQAITYENPTNNPLINQYFFGWNRSTQSYNFANTLEPGYGYWTFAYTECDLRAENISLQTDSYITNIEENWNIISIPNSDSVNKADIIISNNGSDYIWSDAVNTGLISDYVFRWDRNVQSYSFSNIFEAGDCYWMYSYQQCILKVVN